MQRREARAASIAAPPSRRTSRPTPAHGPASVAIAPPENSPYWGKDLNVGVNGQDFYLRKVIN